MAVVAQRDGVRVVAPQKCGHTSIINTFTTPVGEHVARGARRLEALHGASDTTKDWPAPLATVLYTRHPLARIWSVYKHLVREKFREQFEVLGVHSLTPFETFCEAVIACPDLAFDLHLKPQWDSMREARVGTMWLARLEEANWKWPQMCATFDLDCTHNLVSFNKSSDSTPWPRAYHRMNRSTINDLLNCYGVDMDYWENL